MCLGRGKGEEGMYSAGADASDDGERFAGHFGCLEFEFIDLNPSEVNWDMRRREKQYRKEGNTYSSDGFMSSFGSGFLSCRD